MDKLERLLNEIRKIEREIARIVRPYLVDSVAPDKARSAYTKEERQRLAETFRLMATSYEMVADHLERLGEVVRTGEWAKKTVDSGVDLREKAAVKVLRDLVDTLKVDAATLDRL